MFFLTSIRLLDNFFKVSLILLETLYLCEKYSSLFLSSMSKTASKRSLLIFEYLHIFFNLSNLFKYKNSGKIIKKISFKWSLSFIFKKLLSSKILSSSSRILSLEIFLIPVKLCLIASIVVFSNWISYITLNLINLIILK